MADRTRTTTTPTPIPPALRVTNDLNVALTTWSTSQRTVIGLAADFAESGEWSATGAVSAAHWIAGVADIEVCTARERIRVGRRLRALPLIAELFEADELSYSKVRTLSRIATPENERELAAIAAGVPAGALPRAIAAWLHRTSNDAELERHQHEQRSVTWRNEPDGLVTFTARLPPLIAGALISQLTTRVMSTRPNAATPIEQWPTLAQQHADALAHLLREGAGALTTEVIIHVRNDGATLDDGTPLPMSVVERIAPEAFIRALIHDADNRPINASAKRRHPSTRQKRVVKERDRACVDCGATTLLEYDHIPDFAQTGHTLVEELELRCGPLPPAPPRAGGRSVNAVAPTDAICDRHAVARTPDDGASHTCYACRMADVASRELRNSTRSLLNRVEAGETITITVDGRPTAVLAPVGRRPRWAGRNEFVANVLTHQADAALADDLDELAGEMTDERPLP